MNWFSEVLWTLSLVNRSCVCSAALKIRVSLASCWMTSTHRKFSAHFRNWNSEMSQEICEPKYYEIPKYYENSETQPLNCPVVCFKQHWTWHLEVLRKPCKLPKLFPLLLILCLVLLNRTKTWTVVFYLQIQNLTLLGSNISLKHLLLWNYCT